MSEYPRLFFVADPQAKHNPTDRSLIPEYFPPGEKVKNPEPIAELSESDDGTDTSN